MSRVFVSDNLKDNSTLEIQGEKHHYLKNVLRMKSGDSLFLFNGSNKEYKATISRIEKNQTIVQIQEGYEVQKESPIDVVIGQGVPKGQKLDDLIPQITELGVKAIVPLITERSDLKTVSKEKRIRWQKIAEHAAQQTGRTHVPQIHDSKTLKDFLIDPLSEYGNKNSGISEDGSEKILFYELETSQNFESILTSSSKKSFLLLIGPEGGFTLDEVQQAKFHGYRIVSLGSRILRTETVAPAVTAILQYVKGDLNLR